MAPEPEGLTKPLTRVICHLPVSRIRERKVIERFVQFLERQRKKPLGLSGYCKSATDNPVFSGFWRSSVRGKFVRERIVLFMIDYDCDLEDPALLMHLAEMKAAIQGWYQEYTGQPQDEIWIVAHPIVRVVQ